MATAFNGTDLTFNSVALEITDLSYSSGAVPRVDVTSASSSFRQYLAGIPEAFSVTTTGLVSPGAVGVSSTFTGGPVTPTGTYRIESVEVSGSLDAPMSYTATFVRTA